MLRGSLVSMHWSKAGVICLLSLLWGSSLVDSTTSNHSNFVMATVGKYLRRMQLGNCSRPQSKPQVLAVWDGSTRTAITVCWRRISQCDLEYFNADQICVVGKLCMVGFKKLESLSLLWRARFFNGHLHKNVCTSHCNFFAGLQFAAFVQLSTYLYIYVSEALWHM